MGVQMFSGKYYRCVDHKGVRVNATYVVDKRQCLLQNLSWVNPDINFDNVLNAYLSLFQVVSLGLCWSPSRGLPNEGQMIK